MFPIQVKDGMLEITIIPYRGEVKKNHRYLSLSDWTNVFFKLNCSTGKHEFVKVENRGI